MAIILIRRQSRQSCDFFFFPFCFWKRIYKSYKNANRYLYNHTIEKSKLFLYNKLEYGGGLQFRKLAVRHKNKNYIFWRYLLWLAVPDLMYLAQKKRKN